MVNEIPDAPLHRRVSKKRVSASISHATIGKVALDIVCVVKNDDFIAYGPFSHYFHDFSLQPKMVTMKPEYHEGPETLDKFKSFMKRLVAVPHSEIKAKLDAEKAAKRTPKKKRASRVSRPKS